MDKLIQRLTREGKLRKIGAGFIQIENLLRESVVDLGEAKKIADLAERATYIMAYIAILKAGRALLLLQGYAPADGAQHKTVVEVTSAILGEKYRDLTDHFEIMRRKRNEMTYEAGGLLSKSDSQKAFSDAILLVRRIVEEVRAKNPQLELKIDLDQ